MNGPSRSRFSLRISLCSAWLVFLVALAVPVDAAEPFRSHPPMRPLPTASQRPPSPGKAFYVDGARGDDGADGSQQAPWKTLAHAVPRLKPGQTLYLRGGVYHSHVRVTVSGLPGRPITIRSYPGELAIVDGGLPAFLQTPQTAWQPAREQGVPGAVKDEYVSTARYPQLGGRAGATNVLGQFADSMIPLHGYRFLTDLRSRNEYLAKLGAGKTAEGSGAYCGPGVYYDRESGRIHIRLAHTAQRALGDNNYRGETDPRRLPLVIAGMAVGPTLTLADVHDVRVQDLVFRGARTATVSIADSQRIVLEGVTMYGGASPIEVRRTAGLRLRDCACRGIAAPWTFRGSLKYRAIEARLFSASGWIPTVPGNRDFELAYSEFTDCVDGVFLGNVHNVRFHHNLIDNLSDDGIFLTATTAYDGTTPGGEIHIYQNLLARCLTTFAFGVGHGRQKMTPTGRQTGAGVYVYRNILDFRRPVHYQQPAEGQAEITTYGRVAGDHGGPLWEPMIWTHNTIVSRGPPFRNYYAAGLGSHLPGGSRRRLLNNLVLQIEGKPGYVLPAVVPFPQPARPGAKKKDDGGSKLDAFLDQKKPRGKPSKPKAPPLPIDFYADGNLHWSYGQTTTREELFGRFLGSADSARSRALYGPGWIARDQVADPHVARFVADWRRPIDLRLRPQSPAANAGVKLPDKWPDPLADRDHKSPDIGALPLGTHPWPIGVAGRLNVFGRPIPTAAVMLKRDPPLAFATPKTSSAPPAGDRRTTRPVLIIKGYPAFDAPLLEYALRKAGVPVTTRERTWIDPREYARYRAVAIVGSLPRAKIMPNKYSAADLVHVRQYLEGGGRLCLLRGNHWVFRTAEGERFWEELAGGSKVKRREFQVLRPQHAWLKHLTPQSRPKWVNVAHAEPVRATRGEILIGDRSGLATLYRVQVGRGQLIYVGWNISSALPHGRKRSTVPQERAYEQQMQVLAKIAESL